MENKRVKNVQLLLRWAGIPKHPNFFQKKSLIPILCALRTCSVRPWYFQYKYCQSFKSIFLTSKYRSISAEFGRFEKDAASAVYLVSGMIYRVDRDAVLPSVGRLFPRSRWPVWLAHSGRQPREPTAASVCKQTAGRRSLPHEDHKSDPCADTAEHPAGANRSPRHGAQADTAQSPSTEQGRSSLR